MKTIHLKMVVFDIYALVENEFDTADLECPSLNIEGRSLTVDT